MNFWKRYPGDYGRDTAHLRLAEHGAYTIMLDHAYSTRRPLSASMDDLFRLCRASTKLERLAVEAVARQFFPIGPDGLRHNPRADREIELWEAKAEQNREIGKRGGRPRKNDLRNPDGLNNETQTVSTWVSPEKPRANPLQNPESRIQKEDTQRGADAPGACSVVEHLIEEVRAIYPRRPGPMDWLTAAKDCETRLSEGVKREELVGGTERYSRYCAREEIEARFVRDPSRFFKPDGGWAELWENTASANIEVNEQEQRQARALEELMRERDTTCAGFRNPHPGETADTYRQWLGIEVQERLARSKSANPAAAAAARAAAKRIA